MRPCDSHAFANIVRGAEDRTSCGIGSTPYPKLRTARTCLNAQAPGFIAPERLARLEQLLDRQEILDCITGISRGIDRLDRELFLSGYHPDAVIDAGHFVGDPATVYEGGAALHERGQSSTLHDLPNYRCDIDGDVAHAETYWLYVGSNRDGMNWAAGGRYLD
jgi:hypothetical protein